MIAAWPWPPPTQSAATPRPELRRRISCRRVTRMRPPLAPIGCPRAIAPPCGLIRSGSMSSSLSTASDCAAKCLIELEQIDVNKLEPGFRQRLAYGGDWADAHDLRLDPDRGVALDCPKRPQAELVGLACRHHDYRCRSVVDPRGVARGDGAAVTDR